MTKKKNPMLSPGETPVKPNPAEAAGGGDGAKDSGHGGNSAPDPHFAAVREVGEWLLRGENEIAVAEAVKNLFPDFDLEDLLSAARTYLSELAGTDPEIRRTWHIAARRELYRRSVEIHDYKTARDILRDLGQIEGLYPKQSPTKTKPPAGDQADGAQAPFDGIPTADGFPVV